MKNLYLFDIDGTLLSPGPVARKIINEVIESATGDNSDLQIEDVAGLTDIVIIRNALQKHGFAGILSQKIEEVLQTYLVRFEKEYAKSDMAFTYDDAIQYLDYVEHQGHAKALLTGNVRRGAEIKLGKFNLFDRFSFGAFGDDAEDRLGLPMVARERAWDILTEAYRYDNMVIVGDTPHDARVADHYGMESIIVCRKPEWKEEILQAGATTVVDSLEILIH